MVTHTTAPAAEPKQKPSTSRGRVALAVALNCVVPGLGLVYLGRLGFAISNFLIACVLTLVCLYGNQPALLEHIHWVWLIIAVGSGAVAHAFASGSEQVSF